MDKQTSFFDSPRRAVDAYLRAGDEGGHGLLRRAFHPAARLQWTHDGQPRSLPQVAWWPRFEGTVNPALQRDCEELDREGGLALYRATSRWSSHRFDDFLLAAHTPEGWRIVGKVFDRVGSDDPAGPAPQDAAAIEGVLRLKIRAHERYDWRLLLASHLPDCDYFRVNVDGDRFRHLGLSEAASRYASLEDQGVTDPDSPWRVLAVHARRNMAAAKLDVLWQGRRCIDYLLLLRTGEGWRIASVVWGCP